MTLPLLTAAFLTGLFGSGHCFTMCGGIASALSMHPTALSQHRLKSPLLYNLGRLGSYTLLGAFAGTLGALLGSFGKLDIILRTISGLLLISIGLHISIRYNGLRWLENAGARLWKQLTQPARHILQIPSRYQPLILGMLWGWLPCGMVYSALATAAASGTTYTGALTMLFFGLGTTPAMLTIGLSTSPLRNWLRHPRLRILAGNIIILFGCWTLWAIWLNPTIHHHH